MFFSITAPIHLLSKKILTAVPLLPGPDTFYSFTLFLSGTYILILVCKRLEHLFQKHSAVQCYILVHSFFFILLFFQFLQKLFLLALSFLPNYHNSISPLGFLAVRNVNGLFQHRNEMNFIWITNYICIIAHVKILFLTQAHTSGAWLCLSAMYGPFEFIVWPSVY